MKATKFRDLSEFSECIQNDLAKSCLPCQSLYVNQKIFGRARKALGRSLALQGYAGLLSSNFLCKVAKDMKAGDTGQLFILFVPLLTLSLLSKIVRSL